MLPSLTAALIVGLLLGSEFPYFPLSVSLALLALLFGACLVDRFTSTNSLWTTAFCAVLLGGVVYWSLAIESSRRTMPGESFSEGLEDVIARVVEPVQQGPDRLVLVLRVDESTNGLLKNQKVRLTWRVPDRMVLEGDRVRCRAKWRLPAGSVNPGGFDYAAYLDRQGIDAVATVTGAEAVQVFESGYASAWWRPWNQFDRWRSQIRAAAIRSIPQPALGFYLGIIIGDRGYLDPELRDRFMVTGTVHLLSISGSHLGLIGLLTFGMIRQAILLLPAAWLLNLSRWITPTRIAAVGTMVPMTGYACLAGAELATLRSLLMAIMAMAAVWLGHERRMFHAVSIAAALILLHDPQAIFDISFQLSFLSVLAIAAWLAWSTESGQRGEQVPDNPSMVTSVLKWGKDSVALSLAITVTTIPLVAWYFNQLPWLGVFTNLFAVPLTGLILVPIGLLAALGHLAVGGEVLPLAAPVQWLLEMFDACVRVLATIPGGEWHVAAPSLPAVLLFYGSLVLLCLRWRHTVLRIGAALVAVVTLCWWIWSPRTMLDGDRFRVTFLDVGQGDSAVVELPNGEVVLIDAGATYERFDMGRGVVAPYLWNRGIRTVDHAIGTHLQLDHVGGLAWVVGHVTVKQFWGSGETREEGFAQRLRLALNQRGLTEQAVREGQVIAEGGGCRLHALNPSGNTEVEGPLRALQKSGTRLNNQSIVVHLGCGPHSVLFTADVEREGLAQMARVKPRGSVDVLKVPHHGALSSQHREWLASVDPTFAVISVGRHNPYGHPAPAVLESYVAEGARVFRTDRDGAVWVTGQLSSRTLHMHRMSDIRLRPTVQDVCLWACERANWERVWQQWSDRL